MNTFQSIDEIKKPKKQNRRSLGFPNYTGDNIHGRMNIDGESKLVWKSCAWEYPSGVLKQHYYFYFIQTPKKVIVGGEEIIRMQSAGQKKVLNTSVVEDYFRSIGGSPLSTGG